MVARFVAAAARAACMGIVTSVTIAAAAEPTATELLAARDLFSKAEKDEDAGRWQAALEKVRRAAAVKTTPGLRFHIALCEEKLGQLAAALDDYAASEALARTDGNKEVLDAVTDPLAALQVRVPTLTLKVRPDVAGVAITVDANAVPAATWGSGIRLDVGRHVVSATAAGRQPFNAAVTLEERDSKAVDVDLPPVVPASTLPAAPVAPPLPQPSAPPPPSPSHTAALVATAGAVALVGAGVASFLVAGGKQSDAQTQCRQLVSCDDLKGPIRAFDWLALGAWASGAVVGTLAVVLWARPGAPASLRAELVVGPGSAGLRGSF